MSAYFPMMRVCFSAYSQYYVVSLLAHLLAVCLYACAWRVSSFFCAHFTCLPPAHLLIQLTACLPACPAFSGSGNLLHLLWKYFTHILGILFFLQPLLGHGCSPKKCERKCKGHKRMRVTSFEVSPIITNMPMFITFTLYNTTRTNRCANKPMLLETAYFTSQKNTKEK